MDGAIIFIFTVVSVSIYCPSYMLSLVLVVTRELMSSFKGVFMSGFKYFICMFSLNEETVVTVRFKF